MAAEAPRDNWEYTGLLHVGARDEDFEVQGTAIDFKVALAFDVLRNTKLAIPRPSEMPPFGIMMLSAEAPGVGLSITTVAEDSAAAKAGLQRGYVLTAVNGTSVCGMTSVMASERMFSAMLSDLKVVLSAHPSVQSHRSARFETRVVNTPDLHTTSALTLLRRGRELAVEMNKPCAVVVDAGNVERIMAIVAHLDADPELVPLSDDDGDDDDDDDFSEWLCPLHYRAVEDNTERVRVVGIRRGVTAPALAKALSGIGITIVAAIEQQAVAETIRKAVDLVEEG